MKTMSQTKDKIELKKKHWRSIIAEATDTIIDLKDQLTEMDEKEECVKLLIDDLIMIRSEATVELLRIKVSEGYELDEKEEEIE
jgi:hypothetical protein